MNEKQRRRLPRRSWLQGLGAAALATSRQPAAAISSRPHRQQLKAGPLSALVVDNHDGLAGQQQIDRRSQMPVAADREGSLFCTVPFKDRFNGYNGLARLHYNDAPSPFLPCAAGHNCEFVFDPRERTYEPRWSDQPKFIAQPSTLDRLSDTAVVLSIDAGRRWEVPIESRFELREPFFVDIEHSFTPQEGRGASGEVLGVFWASYLQVPRETAFYFRSANGRWTSVFRAVGHGKSGVIAPLSGPVGTRLPASGAGTSLLYGVAKARYGTPLYCGQTNGMLLAYMFQAGEDVEIRFAFNPSGGGPGVPAWDYQALVADPRPGRRYSFKTRTVYKPFAGLGEAVRLYRGWTG